MTVDDDLRATSDRDPIGRPRLLASVLVVAAVVAVAVVAVTVIRPEVVRLDPASGIGGEPAVGPQAVPSTTGSPAQTTLGLVEEVWPEAVVTVPRKLDDGTVLEGLLFADRGTVVLRSRIDLERTAAFYAYDLAAKRFRKITDVNEPEERFSGGYAMAGDRLVWWVNEAGYTNGEVWAAPFSGGPPVRLAQSPRGAFGRIQLVGDRLIYSLQGGDVLSVPVEGGTVSPVPGGQGLTLLEWPWAGTPSDVSGEDKFLFRHLVDLETGATADAVVGPGELYVQCGVTVCTGSREQQSFVRNRDGSDERPIPGLGLAPAADRFLHLKEGTGRLIDLRTGKVADLGVVIPEYTGEAHEELLVEVTTRDVIAYQRGQELVFIDLRRIIAGS
ncbi:hypothetical protein [Herbidospora daliensis]|uniref:hypothetical protein n=1 Tax=Herbidospora daliensis TaxID=295585 RepID=UPI0007861282|nr:hypothetical protein [Herbidospora daliensis]